MEENEHEEHCTCNPLDGVMFMVGAQTTPDGDMLPGSFTVIPMTQDPEDGIDRIMRKIAADLAELDMKEGIGSLEVRPIFTWQDWADIPIVDEVKMAALVEAINDTFLETLLSSAKTAEIAAVPWMPRPKAPAED